MPAPNPPDDTRKGTVYADFLTTDGSPISGKVVKAELIAYNAYGGEFLLAGAIGIERTQAAISDANGRATLDLFGNDTILPLGSLWLITEPESNLSRRVSLDAQEVVFINSLVADDIPNGAGLSPSAGGFVFTTGRYADPDWITSLSVSKLAGGVVFASSTCALDSSIDTGGGTDDSAALQALINTLGVGGTLILDGVARISAVNTVAGEGGQSTALKLPSDFKLIGAWPGCGLFLTAGSNCLMLGNDITGNHSFTGKNYVVEDLILNGNRDNQSRYERGVTNAAESSVNWVHGIWFGGFDGLRLRNVTMRNARCFAFVLSNGRNFFIENCLSTWDTLSGTSNNDGLHLWGTLDRGYVTNHQVINNDDDALGFNTNESQGEYILGPGVSTAPAPYGYSRFESTGGSQSNISVKNYHIAGAKGVRILTLSEDSYPGMAAAGACTLDNISLQNITGPISVSAMISVEVTIGTIEISGWYLTGNNDIDLQDVAATTVVINDVIPDAAVQVNATNKRGNYFPCGTAKLRISAINFNGATGATYWATIGVSATRTTTGLYTITFPAFANTGYVPSLAINDDTVDQMIIWETGTHAGRTTTTFSIATLIVGAGLADRSSVSVTIVGLDP